MERPSNLELVRQMYDLFTAGDRASMRSMLTDDFEWQYFGPPDIPWAGQYRGAAGFDQFFARVAGVIEPLHFEAREFIDGGDRVVVLGTSRARVTASGEIYEAQWANVFWLESGRVKRLFDLYDTASIVAALQSSSGSTAQDARR